MIAVAEYYQVERVKMRAVNDLRDSLALNTWSRIGFGEVVRYIFGLNFVHDAELKADLCRLSQNNWTLLADDGIFHESTAVQALENSLQICSGI